MCFSFFRSGPVANLMFYLSGYFLLLLLSVLSNYLLFSFGFMTPLNRCLPFGEACLPPLLLDQVGRSFENAFESHLHPLHSSFAFVSFHIYLFIFYFVRQFEKKIELFLNDSLNVGQFLNCSIKATAKIERKAHFFRGGLKAPPDRWRRRD